MTRRINVDAALALGMKGILFSSVSNYVPI